MFTSPVSTLTTKRFLNLSQNISIINSSDDEGIHLAGWHFYDIQIYFIIAFIVLGIITERLIYSHFTCLSTHVPESSIFIFIGLILSGIIVFGLKVKLYTHSHLHRAASTFLYFLLPIIVLDASMTLCNRVFFDIVFPVLFFAFIGTVLNFLIIGFLLLLVNYLDVLDPNLPNMRSIDFFWFSSILVAVDPVAVLAIFEEIQVDKVLYFYVFGESLYNDAATIVLHDMMKDFRRLPHISGSDIILGIVAFFIVSGGGALIGILFGILTSLVTRITYPAPLIEPGVVYCLAYLSYLFSDAVRWSGLVSMITCGMVQAYYAFHNLHPSSVTIIHRSIKMVAYISESSVFIGIGFFFLHHNFIWYTGFTLWSLFFMLLARFIVCYASCFCLNISGLLVKKISLTDQFVMSYGGLRGAVSCVLAINALADLSSDSNVVEERMCTTSAIAIIIITIVIIGFTMKPLMKAINVKIERIQPLSIFTTIGDNVCDHLAAGVEAIGGRVGRNACRESITYFDIHYVRPILQNSPDSHDEQIVKEYEKVALIIHNATIKPGKKAEYLSQLSEPLKSKLEKALRSGAKMSEMMLKRPKFDRVTSPLGRRDSYGNEISSLTKSEEKSDKKIVDDCTDLSNALKHSLSQDKKPLKHGGNAYASLYQKILHRRSQIVFDEKNQTHNSVSNSQTENV